MLGAYAKESTYVNLSVSLSIHSHVVLNPRLGAIQNATASRIVYMVGPDPWRSMATGPMS
jgi:hypothetical protein